MSIRFYFSQLVGPDINGGIIPVIHSLIPGLKWNIVIDGRLDAKVASGVVLIKADVTVPQHTTLIADGRITYIPFENASGVPLSLTATVGDVPVARRDEITSRLDNNHIPTIGWTLATLLLDVVIRIIRRFHIRQVLKSSDWNESINSLVSDMNVAKKQEINEKLTSIGFDTSVVNGSDTIAEGIRKLLIQEPPIFQGVKV